MEHAAKPNFHSLLLKSAGYIQNALFVSLLLCNTPLGVVMARLKGEGLLHIMEGQEALTDTFTANMDNILRVTRNDKTLT